MPIRKAPLPADAGDQQVNVRLGLSEVERVEEIATAEHLTRSDVIRSWIRDGLDTYDTEGAMLPDEIRDRLTTAADAAGVTDMQALRQAVESWLRLREELADATKPMRFPPRDVIEERNARAAFARRMLGEGK
jgi:predicted DNA-binding protein